MRNLRIMVVDDDELIRWSLQSILSHEADMTIVAQAENGHVAREQFAASNPDLVLLDIQMPVMNGIDCLRELLLLRSDLPVIMLTSFDEEHLIVEAIALGARGYLLKTPEFKDIVQQIRDVMNHAFVMPLQVSSKLANYLSAQKNNAHKSLSVRFVARYGLTDMQVKIVELLPLRISNREIGEKLFLQEGTVKNYISRILEKLEVSTRLEAIQLINRHLE